LISSPWAENRARTSASARSPAIEASTSITLRTSRLVTGVGMPRRPGRQRTGPEEGVDLADRQRDRRIAAAQLHRAQLRFG
jgi:hypothetical protein